MKPFALTALAGVLCLPATYSLSREGSIPLALLIVVLLGAAGGAAAVAQKRDENSFHPWPLLGAFVIGALLSEAVAFVRYYYSFGYQDPKLAVGVGVSVLEFFVISVIGCIALLVAALNMNSRITRRSKRRAASGAPLS